MILRMVLVSLIFSAPAFATASSPTPICAVEFPEWSGWGGYFALVIDGKTVKKYPCDIHHTSCSSAREKAVRDAKMLQDQGRCLFLED